VVFTSELEQLRSIRPEQENLSVILSTNDHLWGQALKAVLETEGIIIVGEPIGEEEIVRLIERLRPKVAIVDSFVAFQVTSIAYVAWFGRTRLLESF
jgi:hypothetical protein